MNFLPYRKAPSVSAAESIKRGSTPVKGAISPYLSVTVQYLCCRECVRSANIDHSDLSVDFLLFFEDVSVVSFFFVSVDPGDFGLSA